MVHEPAPVRLTRVPATLQLPAAAKLTGRPEVAVALTLKGRSPKILPASAPKVMVCGPVMDSVPLPLRVVLPVAAACATKVEVPAGIVVLVLMVSG